MSELSICRYEVKSYQWLRPQSKEDNLLLCLLVFFTLCLGSLFLRKVHYNNWMPKFQPTLGRPDRLLRQLTPCTSPQYNVLACVILCYAAYIFLLKLTCSGCFNVKTHCIIIFTLIILIKKYN